MKIIASVSQSCKTCDTTTRPKSETILYDADKLDTELQV